MARRRNKRQRHEKVEDSDSDSTSGSRGSTEVKEQSSPLDSPVWKSFPTLLYVILFFYGTESHLRYPDENFKSVILKILPIISIGFSVMATKPRNLAHYASKIRILIGLFFSLLGDVCLVWRHTLFIPGLLFFAIAHVFYMLAFNVTPFGSKVAFGITSSAGALTYIYLCTGIQEPVLKILVFLYDLLIFGMSWRALAKYLRFRNSSSLCGFLGALLFVVSDFMIAFDKWIITVPRAYFWIMVTYYQAQLLISLSVTINDRKPLKHQAK